MQSFIDMIESNIDVKAKAIQVNNKVVMRTGEFQAVRDMTVPKSRGSW
jgi:hypothetical protein